jgi:hypothetical protein
MSAREKVVVRAEACELLPLTSSKLDLRNQRMRDTWGEFYADGAVSVELNPFEVTSLLASEEPELALLQQTVCQRLAAGIRHRDIATLAVQQHEHDGLIEIAPGPTVSEGDENGAFVSAWVWVDFSGTTLDKDPDSSPPG